MRAEGLGSVAAAAAAATEAVEAADEAEEATEVVFKADAAKPGVRPE